MRTLSKVLHLSYILGFEGSGDVFALFPLSAVVECFLADLTRGQRHRETRQLHRTAELDRRV